MAAKIRVGLIGARTNQGSWGSRSHIPALKQLGDYELKAICTAHEETAKGAAAEYGAELAFHDLKDLAAHPDIDLLVVAVNVRQHRDIIMGVIDSGKDILCEWPLGATYAESQELAEAAASRGIGTAIGLQGRSDPTVMYMRDLVADGWIGEVISANLTVIGSGSLERPSLRRNQNMFLITGGHNTDLLTSIVGDFVDVSATTGTGVKTIRFSDTGESMEAIYPDHYMFSGTLANGAVAQVNVSNVPYNGSGNRIEIYGREGTLMLSGGAMHIGPSRLMGSQGGQPLAELTPPDKYHLMPEGAPRDSSFNVGQAYARLADGKKSGAAVVPDFDEALKRHRLLESVLLSASEGRRVRVDELA